MKAQTVVLPMRQSVSVMKVSTVYIFSKRVESDSKTIICKLGLKKQPTFSDATFRFPTK